MAKFTQDQCNNLKELSWEVLKDGTNWVRGLNEDDQHFEFEDQLSVEADSDETKKAAAHAYLISDCEYEGAPADLSVAQKSIL